MRAQLFGRFRLDLDQTVEPEPSRASALLAYLLLHHPAACPREQVAAAFWPESADAQARTNLRHVLHSLRADGLSAHLEVTAHVLRWRPDPPVEVDVASFEQLLDTPASDDRQATLSRAVGLYRGDLLADCADEWVVPERSRLRRRYLDALAELARLGLDGADQTASVAAAEDLVRREPLREEGYRLLMQLYAARGDRARALSVYHDCCSTLERELGVAPSAQTRAVHASLLHRPTAGTAPSGPAATDRPPLVGRGPERSALVAAWRAAERRHPCLVLVEGEPGVGKTRLVEEFRAWAARRGALVAEARCYDVEGAPAYGPVAAWLRSPVLQAGLADLPAHHLVELTRLLPDLAAERRLPYRPEPLPEPEQRRRLLDAVAAAIRHRTTPVLLVVDDVQFADPETCAVVHYLLRAEPPAGLLVAATLRGGDLDPRPQQPLRRLIADLRSRHQVVDLPLAALTVEESALLAEGLLGRAPTAAEAHRLHEETEGNALFVVEAVRAGWPVDRLTSPAVQAAIEARLARLAAPARQLVEAAALLGRAFRVDVLAGVTALADDELVAGLDELWTRRIVRDLGTGEYDFSHGKLRDVAAAGVPPARRRLLHRRIASVLEGTTRTDGEAESAGAIAAHHSAAGAGVLAAEWYRRAAETAQLRVGGTAAVTLLDRALTALGTAPPGTDTDGAELAVRTALLAPLAATQGYAAPRLAEEQERARALTETLALTPAPAVLRSLAMTASTRGDFATALRIGHVSAEHARHSADDVLAVEAAFVLGIAAFWQADFATARGHLEDAVEWYRPADRHTHLLHFGNDPKVSCLSRLANTLWFLGEPEAARAARDAAHCWADEIGHGYSRGIALWFGALLAIDMGDLATVRVETQALAGLDGSPQLRLAAAALTGYLTAVDGAAAEGLAAVRAAIDGGRGEEAPGIAASLHRVLLAACLAVQDEEGAVATAEQLLTMGGGAAVWAPEARRVRAAFRRRRNR